jgi:hypothetical protein
MDEKPMRPGAPPKHFGNRRRYWALSQYAGHGTFKAEFSAGNTIVHWNAAITGFEKRAALQ